MLVMIKAVYTVEFNKLWLNWNWKFYRWIGPFPPPPLPPFQYHIHTHIELSSWESVFKRQGISALIINPFILVSPYTVFTVEWCGFMFITLVTGHISSRLKLQKWKTGHFSLLSPSLIVLGFQNELILHIYSLSFFTLICSFLFQRQMLKVILKPNLYFACQYLTPVKRL